MSVVPTGPCIAGHCKLPVYSEQQSGLLYDPLWTGLRDNFQVLAILVIYNTSHCALTIRDWHPWEPWWYWQQLIMAASEMYSSMQMYSSGVSSNASTLLPLCTHPSMRFSMTTSVMGPLMACLIAFVSSWMGHSRYLPWFCGLAQGIGPFTGTAL